MENLSIFNNMNEEEISLFLKDVHARKISFKKDELIFSNLIDNDLTGIILSGSVNIVKYDNNGNRIIINSLDNNSIIGKPFVFYDKDISVISSCESIILFIDYNLLINNSIINHNIINILSLEVSKMNERIELLSKKTIRERLLSYFDMIWQIVINAVYVGIYVTLSMLLLSQYGLYGFCVGTLVATVFKLIIMLVIFRKCKEKQAE